MNTTIRTVDGALRVYATKAPEAEIKGTLTLLGGTSGAISGGGGGGSYTLPAATESRLGGVKIGNGFSVAPDGTISVNQEMVMTNEDLVDESEVAESIANILNGDDAK